MNVDSSYIRRRPRRVRRLVTSPPAGLLPFAVAIAYGGGLWLQFIHGLQGAEGWGGSPGALAWLRDSTFALLPVLLGVWAALLLARFFLSRADPRVRRSVIGVLITTLVALLSAGAAAASSPLHDYLLGRRAAAPAIAGAARMADDSLLGLAANLVIAGLVVALLLRDQAAPRVPRCLQLRRLRPQAIAQRLSGLLLVGVMLMGGAVQVQPLAAATMDSGAPCTAGAPMKTFDITALDVKIPLNRFGDNDPAGKMYTLTENIGAVRAQESNPDYKNRVSIGLHGGDAIQPLVIRANEGDCVTVNFTNSATGGDYGTHIDGLAFQAGSSGDAVGNNPSSATAQGGSRSYTYYVPNDPTLEGVHYIHPGPGYRDAVNHGLFGALVVEPPGSTYLNPVTTSADGVHPDAAKALKSGWEAQIVPGDGAAPFSEHIIIYHAIGNEQEKIYDVNGSPLPLNDPFSKAYRPGARALNYRSEPFLNRLAVNDDQHSVAYSSYTFGDAATPQPRNYQAEPTKIRIFQSGSEIFHIHHLHGGGIRWRFNPKADASYNYADTGLNKHPQTELSESMRTDSQSIGPGETYNLEIEGGAGGVQQGAGEFLFHCHIASHYFAGMWSFWRVFDTLQPDLAPLPGRTPLQPAVDSSQLIGKAMADGTTLTAANLAAWVEPQLPPQGTKQRGANGFSQDAAVMDWRVDTSTGAPVYVGEREDTSGWNDLPRIPKLGPSHPGSLIVDRFLPGANSDRPVILFNPKNGRPAFPLLRTHLGDRPPFAPNMHSGAPYLGEHADQAPVAGGGVQPFANRPDGICPSDAVNIRHNNIVAISLPIQNTAAGVTDDNGALYALAQDKDDIYANKKPQEPLALRANIGDCDFNTLTSEQQDGNPEQPFAKVNIHIHHVQFDTQASDGVITGFEYEQSVRPYKLEDVQLAAAAKVGDTTIAVTSVAKFLNPDGTVRHTGIAVGEGLNNLEVRQIADIDVASKTITLNTALANAHANGEWTGVEYVQYIWYPDTELDNIFFHDHVNGLFGWGHGLVGQFVIEPRGATYSDPKTGAAVPAGEGTILDIHTPNTLAAQQVKGSFREAALFTIDDHPTVGSSINLKANPWKDRTSAGDPSLRFSSYTYGDPFTPIIRAYPGDPVVIRAVNVSAGMQTLHLDGRTSQESRYADANGNETTRTSAIHFGISEKFTLIMEGGAGGPTHTPGDYLYNDGVERSFKDGAWGIVRVLPGISSDLKPLPADSGSTPPSGNASLPAKIGGRPPAAANTSACPTTAPVHKFAVSAVDLPSSAAGGGQAGRIAAFVMNDDVAAVKAGTKFPEPLVLHAAEGECVSVTLTNLRNGPRVSFHLDGLLHDINSSGINVGYNPEQTVAPGQTRTYSYYADTVKLESEQVTDFGGDEGSRDGLYGSVVVAPKGATFSDPKTGVATDHGAQVDIHVPGTPGYRDFSLLLADQDPIIGQNAMPYPRDVSGSALINYRTADPQGKRKQDANTFSSLVNGDPATPILMANAGDQMKVHVTDTQGSEQLHTFSLGGLSWPIDQYITHGEEASTRAIGPQEKFDALIYGGAGGRGQMVGDFAYQDRRLAFTEAGMWGLIRVLPASGPSCTTAPIRALSCPVATPTATPTATTTGTATATRTSGSGGPDAKPPGRSGSSSGTSTGTGTPAAAPSGRSGPSTGATTTSTGTATATATGTATSTATVTGNTGGGAPLPIHR